MLEATLEVQQGVLESSLCWMSTSSAVYDLRGA